MRFTPDREIGNDLLIVDGVSKTIEGKEVLNNVSFTVNPNDKVILLGDEVAKTTLLKILAGEIEPDSGTVKWGITTSRSYMPKDNTEYFEGLKLSLVEWLRQYASPEEESEAYLRSFLGRMLFSGEEALKRAHVLSGGEKMRCMLSKMMLSKANVILLDEPTNHLDLESITAVNEGIIAFKGSVFFTSHDYEFIQTIANRVIELTPEGAINKEMDYENYLKFKGIID